MKKRNLFALLILATGAFTFTSCDDNNDKIETPVDPETNYQYVVVATPDGQLYEGADYVLQANSLTEGSITTKGAGIEQDGYRYYAFNNNKVFSLLYGQGNPGDVVVYDLNSTGKLQHVATVNTPTVQVFGKYDKDLILIKSPRSGDENATLMRIDTEDPQIATTEYVNVVQLAGNGERAHFTGVFQVGNEIYAPYYCIKGVTNAIFHSDFSDSTWVAVFSYPDLKLQRVIKDNRTSYIGYYFAQSGLEEIENGDVYAFSTATLGGDGVVASTKPSAAIRIKKGATQFDQSYFFNIQEKSGGHHLYNARYLGNNKFFLTMYSEKNVTSGTYSFAIVNVVDQSFTWVTGMPKPEEIAAIGRLPYVSEDGKTIAWGIATKSENPHIYVVDVATATATKGLEVQAGGITAVGRLTY
ncbi:MAG: DUF4374 domain-containing protein [Dysgonomonas sp.]